MKARVEKSVLASAVKTVLPAARSASLPICSGVRLDADGGRMILTCTDLDLTIVHEIQVASGEGSAVIPAALLARVVSSFDDGAVTLEWADSMLTVACGETVAKLHGFNLDDWPRLPEQDGEPVELDEANVDLLRRILPFASDSHEKAVIRCVHFGSRQAGTTDSYRLALADLDLDIPECNVPAPMFAAMLRSAVAPLTLTVGDRSASVRSHDTTWTTRLVVDEYPQLDRLVTKGTKRLSFESAALTKSLKRLLILTDDEYPRVRIDIDGDKAKLFSSTADVGLMDDVVTCSGDYEGSLCFNPRFLIDLVTAAATDDVTIELVDALKPVVVRSERLTQVLVPVRP